MVHAAKHSPWADAYTARMDSSVQTWLDGLPPQLSAHRTILRRLVAAVARDARWRWLELSCSVARGAGDAESDLDLGLGAADDTWPHALGHVPALVAELGPVVDILQHRIAEWSDMPHQRTFVQYADGVQLDLVVLPAGQRKGCPPGSVVLYDADGRLAQPWLPSGRAADANAVYEWTFQGWIALADLAKYVRRGSTWEALERLQQARVQVWRLWAVAQGVPYPIFGLTGVLDNPQAGLPPGVEATVAGLDSAALCRAALACAALLDQTADRAAALVAAELPRGMAAFVRHRLEVLAKDYSEGQQH